MADNLNVDTKLKEKTCVQKYSHDEYAQGLKQVKCVPKNEGMRCLKLILQNCTNPKIEGIPKAEQDISPFPDVRYVV